VKKNVVVVGGGIAGLTAAIYLARGGCNVTIFEKRRHVGGRAITHLRHGFRFNVGPHMVVRKGAGRTVYRELGIPIRGGRSKSYGSALIAKQHHKLPLTLLSLLFTSLLNTKGKFEAASLLKRIRKMDTSVSGATTIGEWLDANVVDVRLRTLAEALVRLATYSPDLRQSASAALSQVNLFLRGVVYIDEGWQKIVDALQSNAVTSGVNFVTSSRVIRVVHDDAVRALDLGGLEEEQRDTTVEILRPDPTPADATGARLAVDTVILAVDPSTAMQMVGGASFARGWGSLKPVTATCLDVALSRLPDPKRTFAIGFDRPVYFGVHSAHGQLTPQGGAMVHVAKYETERLVSYDDNYDDDELVRMTEETRSVERELESVLDDVQPGWREFVVHRRFLPSLTVSNALQTPGVTRPPVATPVRGLYLAGDWVGDEGMMADASLASAREAAMAILQQ
jgi:phytoene dehydrogenase-like protein